MIKKLAWVFFLLATSLSKAQYPDASSLRQSEQEVLAAINLVRSNPAHVLHDLLPRWIDSTKTEKTMYVRSLFRELEAYKGARPLERNAILDSMAADHARVMGHNGKIGHSQGKGKDFYQRAEKLLRLGAEAAESLQYGYQKGLDVVFDLLIDEGVPGTGHRKQLLDNHYTLVGVAVYPHNSEYGINTVIDYCTPLPARRTGR